MMVIDINLMKSSPSTVLREKILMMEKFNDMLMIPELNSGLSAYKVGALRLSHTSSPFCSGCFGDGIS
jgi:hypothetical protein